MTLLLVLLLLKLTKFELDVFLKRLSSHAKNRFVRQ